MGITERRQRDKEVLRSKILDAASELFVNEGIPNVSLRKIADKIEYSPATIYLYFRDKNQLLSSLCTETFRHMQTELERIERAGELPPLEALRAGLQFYIEFGLQHPNHYLLTFCTPCEQRVESPDSHDGNLAGLQAFDCLRRALQACKSAGVVEFEDLEATAQSVWTFIHGITSLLILYENDPCFPWVGREKLIRNSLDLILKALRPC